MAGTVGVGEYGREMPRHGGTVVVEFDQQRGVTGETHGMCDDRLVFGFVRQAVRLCIVQILQPVFEAAQKLVGGGQFERRVERDLLPFGEQRQHLQRRLDLQLRVAATADQLEYLGDELDLADAAGAELDVAGHVLARHLAADLRVQAAHRVDCAEIQIFAEDEGAT